MFVNLSLLIVLVVGLCSQSFAEDTATTVVNWLNTISLDGVAGTSLTAADQKVLAASTATTLGLPASSVTYESHGLASQSGDGVTYIMTVGIRTNVVLGDTSYTDARVLFNTTTAALTDAVNDGSYEELVKNNAQAAGTPDLYTVSAFGTQYTQYSAGEPINKDENLDLTSGGTAIIVICALVMFFVVIWMVWSSMRAKHDDSHGKPNSAKGYAISEDEV